MRRWIGAHWTTLGFGCKRVAEGRGLTMGSSIGRLVGSNRLDGRCFGVRAGVGWELGLSGYSDLGDWNARCHHHLTSMFTRSVAERRRVDRT